MKFKSSASLYLGELPGHGLQAGLPDQLPSRYEGVPLVMLEAIAMGVPVVASDLPGTRPFLTDKRLFPCWPSRASFRDCRVLARPGSARAHRGHQPRGIRRQRVGRRVLVSRGGAGVAGLSMGERCARAGRLESLGQVLDLTNGFSNPEMVCNVGRISWMASFQLVTAVSETSHHVARSQQE